jgi:hypothetical protein
MRILRYLAAVFLIGAGYPLEPVSAADDAALLYAQQCVAEVSLSFRMEVPKADRVRQKIEECKLMWHILRGRAGRASLSDQDMVRKYNTLFKRTESRRHYILYLNPQLIEPKGWPVTEKWDVYAGTWQKIYEAAQTFVAKPSSHPCPEANQFGGRCDDADHACDHTPDCWTRQWCERPSTWFSQAYYTGRNCSYATSKVLPASVAAGQ